MDARRYPRLAGAGPLALLPHALLIAVLEHLESRLDGVFLALAPTREEAAATYAEFERLSRRMEGVRIAWAHGSPPPPLTHAAPALAPSSARARLDAHKRDSATSAPLAAAATTGEAGPSASARALDASSVAAHREDCVCGACQDRPNVVVGTPAFVRDALRAGRLRLARLRMVVFDEVARMWADDWERGAQRDTLREILGAAADRDREVQRVVIANPFPWARPAAQALFMPEDRPWGAYRYASGPHGGWTLQAARVPASAAAAGSSH